MGADGTSDYDQRDGTFGRGEKRFFKNGFTKVKN